MALGCARDRRGAGCAVDRDGTGRPRGGARNRALLGGVIAEALTVRPGAEGGDLLLTPVSVTLGGNKIDLGALAGLLGPMGETISKPQHICIADRFPAGISLTGLRIEGTRAVADISVDGRITVDPTLLENGTCRG